MELKKYKFNTLFWLFLKQLLILATLFLIEIFSFILLFIMGINSGFILPANYSVHYLEQNKNAISENNPFDESLILHTCKYGLFDFDGNYLSGNFDSDIVDEAKAFIKNSNTAKHRFYLIDRANGYCVINYDISAHFSSHILHKLFPNLELILLISFIIVFVVTVLNRALCFGKKLKKELTPLLDEIEQIQNRELDMEHKISNIKEFNDILLSLYDMKIALSQSLKKEWETEQKRKRNISALAHDIKTPLTIIKGNSELIGEEKNIVEIHEFADIINNNSDKIQRYIKLLIDETNNNVIDNNEQKIELSTLIRNIISESEALCKPNNIELITYNMISYLEITVNIDLIERAVINIVKNAAEHTILDKKIKLSFEYSKNNFIVTVEDFGKGFTSEALKYAKNQFYTEKYERSEEHYGLGMYFANSVAKKFNGNIKFWNKPNQTGSVVVLQFSF